jgi:hypothetical protein
LDTEIGTEICEVSGRVLDTVAADDEDEDPQAAAEQDQHYFEKGYFGRAFEVGYGCDNEGRSSRRRSGEADAIDKFLVALGLECSKTKRKNSFLLFNRVFARSLDTFSHERIVQNNDSHTQIQKSSHLSACTRVVCVCRTLSSTLVAHPS